MNVTPIAPGLPGHPNRRGWLIAFGVLEVMIAAMLVLFAATTALYIPRVPPGPNVQQPQPGMYYGVAAIYLVIAAFFVVCAIGSFLAKNWARLTMIVVSAIWLAFGVLGTLVMAVLLPVSMQESHRVLQQQNPQAAAQLAPGFQTFMVGFMLVFMALAWVVLPLVFLVFYSRPSVRATCLLASGIDPASRRAEFPIVNGILAGWFASAAAAHLAMIFFIPGTAVFGMILHGTSARILMAVQAFVSALCAWAFIKRDMRLWWVALANVAWLIASGIVSVIRMSPAEMMQLSGQSMASPGMAIYRQHPGLLSMFMLGGLAIAGVQLGLILYSRRHFPGQKRAEPPEMVPTAPVG